MILTQEKAFKTTTTQDAIRLTSSAHHEGPVEDLGLLARLGAGDLAPVPPGLALLHPHHQCPQPGASGILQVHQAGGEGGARGALLLHGVEGGQNDVAGIVQQDGGDGGVGIQDGA